jgi:hypothetical protein
MVSTAAQTAVKTGETTGETGETTAETVAEQNPGPKALRCRRSLFQVEVTSREL